MRSKPSRSASRAALGHRVGVIGEARRHRAPGSISVRSRCRAGRARSTPASAEADGDERVLERVRARSWAWTLPGRHAGDAEKIREPGEAAVAGPIPAPERSLELHPEAVGAEDPQQLAPVPLGVSMLTARDPAGEGAVAGASGETDQAVGVMLEVHRSDRRRRGHAVAAGLRVRQRQQVTEIAVPGHVLDQHGQVEGAGRAVAAKAGERGGGGAGEHRQLGPRDRPDPLVAAGLGELHRPPEAVVIGQGHGLVAELRRPEGQLVGAGGAVEE